MACDLSLHPLIITKPLEATLPLPLGYPQIGTQSFLQASHELTPNRAELKGTN